MCCSYQFRIYLLITCSDLLVSQATVQISCIHWSLPPQFQLGSCQLKEILTHRLWPSLFGFADRRTNGDAPRSAARQSHIPPTTFLPQNAKMTSVCEWSVSHRAMPCWGRGLTCRTCAEPTQPDSAVTARRPRLAPKRTTSPGTFTSPPPDPARGQAAFITLANTAGLYVSRLLILL